MFYSRGTNIKINNLHDREIRLVYQDYTSSFEELLVKENSVTIHQRHLQSLAILLLSTNVTYNR